MTRRALWLRIGQRHAAGSPPFISPESPTQLDLDMMDRALALAQHAASLGEVPVGAVVYDPASAQVVAEAHNTRETDRRPDGHAEFLAITAAAQSTGDWRLNHLALAVTLEPCPMCAGLIVNARLGRVVFGAKDPKAGACGSVLSIPTDPRLNHRVTPIHGVRAGESAALLREFFRARRKS